MLRVRSARSLALFLLPAVLAFSGCVGPRAALGPRRDLPLASRTATGTGRPIASTHGTPTAAASPVVSRTPTATSTPVDPVALGLPTAGPLGLAGVRAPRLLHWFEGRPDSRLLVVRDDTGTVVATWRPPEGAEIRHLSEALSPDRRYLTWLSGERPDEKLAGPLDDPLTLHILDLATGEERYRQVLMHPGMLDELRRQVLTVGDWGTPASGDWTPSWLRPEGPLDYYSNDRYTTVIQIVFEEGIGRTAWSPDGSRLAVVAMLDGPTSDVYLVDSSGYTMRRLTSEPEHVTRIDWSPDGRTVIYKAGWEPLLAGGMPDDFRATYLVDVASGARHRFPTAEPGPPSPSGPMMNMVAPSYAGNDDGWPDGWTRDGRAIVVPDCWLCGLLRYDPGSGEEARLLATSDDFSWFYLASMPWGDWAVASGDGMTQGEGQPFSGSRLVHLTDGALEQLDELPRDAHYWGLDDLPFLMADRAEPFVGTALESIAIASATPMAPFALGPGGRRMPIEGLPSRRPVVAVSPGGHWRVACGREAKSACKVYGDGPRPVGGWTDLPVEYHQTMMMAFAPDGNQLALLSDGALYLVDLPDGQPQRLSAWTSTGYGGSYPEYRLADALAWFGGVAGK